MQFLALQGKMYVSENCVISVEIILSLNLMVEGTSFELMKLLHFES